MDKNAFVQLYDYTFWADRKLFDCALTLTEEQYRQPVNFSIGPIREQLGHLMAVEYWWIHFLKTGELDFIDEEASQLSREELRRKWDAVEQEIRDYLAALTPEELERPVKPQFWEEHEAPIKVWQALIQVANHSTDHRTQTMAMLHTLFGAPTFEQDFLYYLQEKSAASG